MPPDSQTILSKMNSCIMIMISDFKIYYSGIEIKTVW